MCALSTSKIIVTNTGVNFTWFVQTEKMIAHNIFYQSRSSGLSLVLTKYTRIICLYSLLVDGLLIVNI